MRDDFLFRISCIAHLQSVGSCFLLLLFFLPCLPTCIFSFTGVQHGEGASVACVATHLLELADVQTDREDLLWSVPPGIMQGGAAVGFPAPQPAVHY